MSSIHHQFYESLNTHQFGQEIKEACARYKNSPNFEAFELNGRLKADLPPSHLGGLLENLMYAICAENKSPLELYRMTSVEEFVGPMAPVTERRVVSKAFLSTSSSKETVKGFVPNSGQPLLLKIYCPSGSRMAPMEQSASLGEEEFLLGCGAEFTFKEGPLENDPSTEFSFGPCFKDRKLWIWKLSLTGKPPYVSSSSHFKF